MSSKGFTSSFRGSSAPGAYFVVYASDFGGQGGASSPNTLQLGLAGTYSILAYSGITNTGNTVVSGGNIGTAPTMSITGFPPGQLVLPSVIDNANAAAARLAGNAAFTYYTGLVFTTLASGNLSTSGTGGTNVYTPGNYYYATGMTMPTGIVLNGAGTYIFWGGSTINLASGQSVTLTNGATADSVIWCVGSSFVSVATSQMVGTILAYTSITLGGGTFTGRALAVGGGNGAVSISAATAINSVGGSGNTIGIQNPLPLIAPNSTADLVLIVANTASLWKVQKSVDYSRPDGTQETPGIVISHCDCIAPEYPGTSAVVVSSLSPSAYMVLNGYLFQATASGTTAATFIGFSAFNLTKGATTLDGSVTWTSLGKAVIIRMRFGNVSDVAAQPVAQQYDFFEA